MEGKDKKVKIEPVKAPQSKTVIYLGDTITEKDSLGQVVFQVVERTIFNNGLPAEVLKRCETDNNFKKMFVSIDDTAKCERLLKDSDSDLALAKAECKLKYKGGV